MTQPLACGLTSDMLCSFRGSVTLEPSPSVTSNTAGGGCVRVGHGMVPRLVGAHAPQQLFHSPHYQASVATLITLSAGIIRLRNSLSLLHHSWLHSTWASPSTNQPPSELMRARRTSRPSCVKCCTTCGGDDAHCIIRAWRAAARPRTPPHLHQRPWAICAVHSDLSNVLLVLIDGDLWRVAAQLQPEVVREGSL